MGDPTTVKATLHRDTRPHIAQQRDDTTTIAIGTTPSR